jgi:outer membrane receptor protein involved in Fe transport
MKKFGGSIVTVMFAMAILLTSAHAQTSTGTIVGTVVDKQGGAVPNATVKASSVEFGKDLRTTKTDSAGGYRLESLLPGTYNVSVEAGGFNRVDVTNVQVKGSLLVTANATLEISGVSSTVVVEASAGQELQTESGSLGAEISTQEITNVPVFTLNPIELVVTQPGVQDNTNQMGFSNGVNFSVNGTRPRANNFLIDGQDNNDNSISGQAFQTSNLQAVQEVTILTNAYAAEYGRGGGSVTNEISKTGTNTFHGDAWELNRNNSFAAVDAKNGLVGVTRNPRDNENTFGFDFGGPVKRNKLFFYGTLQDDRDYSAAQGQTLNIPTAAGIATLQGLLPNPNVQLLLSSLAGLVAPSTGSGVINVPLGPGPNGVDRGSVQENLFQRSGIPEIQTTREWRARVDWNATPFDTLNASYRRSDFNLNLDFFNNPASLPPFDTDQSGPAQAFTGNWNHTFSPRAVNEFRFSYSNIDFTFGPTATSASGPLANTPGINFNGTSGLPSLGIITGLPQFRGHKSYQFQEALSYTLGRHSFKMGADIDYLQVDDLVPFNSRGTINVFDNNTDPTTNTPAFSDLANFIDNFTGQGGAVAINFGNPEVQPFVGIYAPYVQDTWHVRPNFTLDLGLRYEYWGTVGNAVEFPSIPFGFGVPGATLLDIASAKQQGDKNNFAPRIGFAYTPHILPRFFGNNRTVIRAGYGIFYDGIFTNILDNTVANSPNATGATFTAGTGAGAGRGLANATGLLASATPVANPQTTIESMATKVRNPLTHQWNLDIERELPGGFVFTAAYVGTRGEHLFVNQELNPGTNQFDAAGNLIRVNPNFGSVVVRDNGGDSIYHSGQFTLDRKFSHGLLLRGAYTYSKLIDDGSEVFTSTGGSTFSEIINQQSSDRGLSAYDRRNRFVGTYVWDLPPLHHSDNMAMNVLGYITNGWSWSGTITAQTGNPETISSGLDFNGDGHSGNDRPNLGNPAAPFTSVGIDGSQLGAATGTIFGPYRDCINGLATCVAQPAANFHFIIPAAGVQGNLGRNTYIGPGQWFYNTGVARTFKLHERHQLTFRAEFFDAFNHPNLFTDAPGVLTGGGTNIIFDAAGANFGKFAQTIAGGRQIKFWLKYSF